MSPSVVAVAREVHGDNADGEEQRRRRNCHEGNFEGGDPEPKPLAHMLQGDKAR